MTEGEVWKFVHFTLVRLLISDGAEKKQFTVKGNRGINICAYRVKLNTF